MQPCPVCAGHVVDGAGYCTQCGTFRGARPPGGVAGLPVGSPGAAPGTPAAGSPLTHPAPAPADHPRSPLVAPLIALSVALVVVVVAIVVVVLVKNRADRVAAIDRCVVGQWRVVEHRELVPVTGFGNVEFSGRGARLRLGADGTGSTDYGPATVFRGTANGKQIELVLSGSVRFRFHTANNVLSFEDLQASGTTTVSVDGAQLAIRPLAGSGDPAGYRCAASTLSEHTVAYQVQMTREAGGP
jgi:hypothetical protein